MASQGFHQVQKLSQSQVLAPQLRQSLKILQVPAIELRNAILEELQANPTLEELGSEDISVEEQTYEPTLLDEEGKPEFEQPESAQKLDFSDQFEILKKMGDDFTDLMYQEAGESNYTNEDAQRRQHFFDSLTGSTSMQEELLDQAHQQEENPHVLTAFEYLIGNLDERGFLTTTASETALVSNIPLLAAQNAVRLLQSLEPVGIGAYSIQECLLIQLRAKQKHGSLAALIIDECWDLLLRRRIPEIARKLSASTEEVAQSIAEIARLDPAPGRKFAEDNNSVVQPDVTVYQDEYDEWQIELNNDYIPRLRISNTYKEILAKGQVTGKDREYLQEKFRSGRFLISSIEQRQQTIERITRQIIKFQKGFFEEGSSALKPLTMNQIAEEVGVHETTVSRAIANKYMRTPHGTFDMKYFFTSGYQSDDGQSRSNTSVKERIAEIISEEPAQKPYSDQRVVQILETEGVKIARRTVAKYRDELNILPTNLRRQYK